MSKQREALELALEALEDYQANGAPFLKCDAAVAAIREALAEPEPEPVAWIVTKAMASPRIQEWKPKDGNYLTCEPLYTAPPARKSLTDEEIDNLELPPNGCTMRELVRVVERAHGIDGGHECWR